MLVVEEDNLRQQAKDLEAVKDLSQVLSSEHLKVTPALSSQLQKLSEVSLLRGRSVGASWIKSLLSFAYVLSLTSRQCVGK